jgi:hypothetical protein
MRAYTFMLACLTTASVALPSGADTDISATNPKAAAAISAVKQLCLSGTQFDLKADVKGNLQLIRLTPGAEGSASVNVRNSTGAAAIFDDKVRQVADEDIRNCIKPYIGKIVEAILGSDTTLSYTWVDRPSSNQVPLVGPFGCRCAAIMNSPSGIKVTNGCNGDLPVTAVRGNWSPPPNPDPRIPWGLVPAAGREFANLTLKTGQNVSFDAARQVYLWMCPGS